MRIGNTEHLKPLTEAELQRLSVQGRAAFARLDATLQSAVQPHLGKLRAMLADIHGMSAVEWLRMAQDEFARTEDVTWAHVVRSVCARSGMTEPNWVANALVRQSHAIADSILSHDLSSAPRQSTPGYRAARDFRIVREIARLNRNKKMSLKKAFKETVKLLPAHRGQAYSAETTKRAWRRFASKRAYDRIYRAD